MELIPTSIEGLVVIKPAVFIDPRGYFFESYNKESLSKYGLESDFVQDNQSMSSANVLRGLHFQNPPHAQGKLVRVTRGSVLDVAVDIRSNSPTYGQHHKIELSERNKLMFWIPKGFAHGFLTLEDNTLFSYKCTNTYNQESEDSIKWNDPDLDIDWGITAPIVSEKDQQAQSFSEFQTPF